MNYALRFVFLIALVVASTPSYLAGQRGQLSPAAERPPESLRPQFYSAGQVAEGEGRFVARCGFCHGRDTGGGEGGGPDLTRSDFVARDVYGNKLRPLLRTGRAGTEMPAFDLNEAEIDSIVAFVHEKKQEAESVQGGRRSVAPEDLRTGNAARGEAYFNGDGRCSQCHSPSGDLAGIATRFEGLALLRRMLYPTFGRPAPAPPMLRVTLPSGETVTGALTVRSQFRVGLRDTGGNERSWATDEVDFEIDDPVSAHFDQLARYTDPDMHDVYAYLETLR